MSLDFKWGKIFQSSLFDVDVTVPHMKLCKQYWPCRLATSLLLTISYSETFLDPSVFWFHSLTMKTHAVPSAGWGTAAHTPLWHIPLWLLLANFLREGPWWQQPFTCFSFDMTWHVNRSNECFLSLQPICSFACAFLGCSALNSQGHCTTQMNVGNVHHCPQRSTKLNPAEREGWGWRAQWPDSRVDTNT